jgi:hypothetical protein
MPMKTTVEIPDELFRQAKAKAALEGIRLRDLVTRGLQLAMETPFEPVKRRRASFPLIRGAPDARPLTDAEVAAALAGVHEEEAARYAGSVRR